MFGGLQPLGDGGAPSEAVPLDEALGPSSEGLENPAVSRRQSLPAESQDEILTRRTWTSATAGSGGPAPRAVTVRQPSPSAPDRARSAADVIPKAAHSWSSSAGSASSPCRALVATAERVRDSAEARAACAAVAAARWTTALTRIATTTNTTSVMTLGGSPTRKVRTGGMKKKLSIVEPTTAPTTAGHSPPTSEVTTTPSRG